MPEAMIPHDDFETGFEVGYCSILGTDVALPPMPPAPPVEKATTSFLMGIRLGVGHALGVDIDEFMMGG